MTYSPRLLVSACLCGIPCRYDATAAVVPELAAMAAAGTALPVCPELAGGLSAPRPPCEIRDGNGLTKTGRDVTDELTRGAEIVLALARQFGVTGAVLKQRSPSCGSKIIYDGTFSGRRIPGQGVTAALLGSHGIPVWSEDDFPMNPEGDDSHEQGAVRKNDA